MTGAAEGDAAQVGAVLRLTAGSQSFRVLVNLRTQGLILMGVVAVLMSAVALLLYRLMSRLIRFEELAAQRDRLQAMGALTAGIAHEIRNPLGVIRTLAEATIGDLDADHPGRELLSDVVGEVERLNGLVNQYLQFARPASVDPNSRADPEKVIRSLAILLQKGEDAFPNIDVDLAENLPVVQMEEAALRQVLLNLLLNAREATGDGSPIAIRCIARAGKSRVEIAVRDHGTGIRRRDLRHVFDPFFSTKESGSGLGLAICRHLVTNSAGTIAIDSKPDQGTTVRIVLPAGEPAASDGTGLPPDAMSNKPLD
jgi:two-component system sensor histidine kinase HydH